MRFAANRLNEIEMGDTKCLQWKWKIVAAVYLMMDYRDEPTNSKRIFYVNSGAQIKMKFPIFVAKKYDASVWYNAHFISFIKLNCFISSKNYMSNHERNL